MIATFPSECRFGHRSGAELVLGLGIGAGAEQPVHQLHVAVMRGPMQRRGAVGRGRIHVDVLVDQRDRGLPVIGLHQIHQRDVARDAGE